MDGGNLFRVRTDARTRVRAEMAELLLHKNEVGGYAYNDAKTLAIQIERVLERQLFEDSSDGMKGLASSTPNTLTKYRANINIKKKDVIAQSAAAAADASTSTNTVAPEITADNAQEEADRQNVFRLAAIGVKKPSQPELPPSWANQSPIPSSALPTARTSKPSTTTTSPTSSRQ